MVAHYTLPRVELSLCRQQTRSCEALELEYLHEIKRSTTPAETILNELRAQIGLATCDLPFDQVVRKATELTWTHDPFDRLIVAQALCRDFRLLTKDAYIRRHARLAFWA
jgi:PIN domain nuclease of toxin-antitoxin system